jgi:8-oxo-dGTP pyrophosphatase MutT (NUDIX family)
VGFLDRIAECNRHDLSRFVPLRLGKVRVGFVRVDRVPIVLGSKVVQETDDGLVVEGVDFDSWSAALGAIARHAAAAGAMPAPYCELYAVGELDSPLASVDRSAVAFLGIRAFGVHLNGFVRGRDGISMWIAHRSRTKPTFPGMLDNLVAGGQPVGLSLEANLRKECLEEAGIDDALARRAVAVGSVSYCAEHDRGLKPDTMFCYDLELPADFAPCCNDGEVERFELLPIGEVAAIVRDTQRFKFNCNLVIIDFLVRHGLLGPGDADADVLARALRQGSRPISA